MTFLVLFLFLSIALGLHVRLRERFGTWWGSETFGAAVLLVGGSLGLLIAVCGTLPRLIAVWVGVSGVLAAVSLIAVLRRTAGKWQEWPRPGGGGWQKAAVAVGIIAMSASASVVSALVPPDMLEWDTLAYHLALVKQAVETGRFEVNPTIHHSYFPMAMHGAMAWGFFLAGEQGARSVVLTMSLATVLFLFGYVGRRTGSRMTGGIAALTLASMPIFVWMAGTNYVDFLVGAFVLLGAVFGIEFRNQEGVPRKLAMLASGASFGVALGSKYTGLVVVAFTMLALTVAAVRTPDRSQALKGLATIAVVAALAGGYWYVRNAVLVGDPFYPFGYGLFGGPHWSDWRATIYAEEQRTFGLTEEIRRGSVASIAPSILGLVYQPGRYVNPGQNVGLGSPYLALGFALPILLLVAGLRGSRKHSANSLWLAVALGILFWLATSQQVRYLASWIPLTVALGALSVRGKGESGLASIVLLQSLATFSLFWILVPAGGRASFVGERLDVLLGRESRAEYLARRVGFARPSAAINREARGGRVALFDEVFGYLLDVPYVWANPSHSTLLGIENCRNGAELLAALRKHGISHVYVSLRPYPAEERAKWLAESGLPVDEARYSAEEKAALASDPRSSWRLTVAQAIAQGVLIPVHIWNSGVLLRLRGEPEEVRGMEKEDKLAEKRFDTPRGGYRAVRKQGFVRLVVKVRGEVEHCRARLSYGGGEEAELIRLFEGRWSAWMASGAYRWERDPEPPVDVSKSCLVEFVIGNVRDEEGLFAELLSRIVDLLEPDDAVEERHDRLIVAIDAARADDFCARLKERLEGPWAFEF